MALIGSVYALWGGLKSVAFSDTLNGIGLYIGGLLITYFALVKLGNGSFMTGLDVLPQLPTCDGIGHGFPRYRQNGIRGA